MNALISLLIIMALAVLIIRLATVALVMTGLIAAQAAETSTEPPAPCARRAPDPRAARLDAHVA